MFVYLFYFFLKDGKSVDETQGKVNILRNKKL